MKHINLIKNQPALEIQVAEIVNGANNTEFSARMSFLATDHMS